MSNLGICLFTSTGSKGGGQLLKGQLRAPNIQWAKHKLRKKGIRVNSIRRCWQLPFSRHQTILSSDTTLFTRQLATLLKVGIPIDKSLDILANSHSKPIMNMLMYEINDDIFIGDSLSKALRKHSQQFDDLFCNMVEIGETTGTLVSILERLANHRERTERFKKRIKKAMTYPLIVLLITILVTALMLTQVIPGFAQTFSQFDADLPVFTLFVLQLSDMFQRQWLYMLVITVACISGFAIARKRSIRVSHLTDKMVLKLPLAGKLLTNLILARFSRTLATTFSAGLPILDALKSAASAANNSVYTEAIYCMRKDIAHGVSLHRAIRKQSIFPTTLQQMITVGEESGSLGQILDRAGQLYESSIETSLDSLIPMIEPIMILIIGLIVGGLLLAMYLPVFQLGHII
jgi:type IV pilus assembly protein PilC